MPRPRNPDWVDWRSHEGREILLEDLENDVLPLDEDVMTAEEAWEEIYMHLHEFHDVVFSQFKARLKDHRKQVARRKNDNVHHILAYQHDREMYPRIGHNKHGEPVFDLSAAKPLLKADVADEKHLEMTAAELFHSRDEYHEHWEFDVFQRRLRQEIRTAKWMYYLDWKRAKKLQKRGLKSQDQGPDSEEEDSDEDYEGNDSNEEMDEDEV